MEKGVVVAADLGAEWLLPWWWKHYSACNSFPVAFVDFGMSDKARLWCEEKGTLLTLNHAIPQVASKEEVSPARAQRWEALYGENVWKVRAAWFKKPFALLKTPFDRSLWMDLDCEVCGNIGEIFAAISPSCPLGVVRESEEGVKKPIYNSGVIVYEKNAALLHEWALRTLSEHQKYIGDEDILSRLLWQDTFPFIELPLRYNWMMVRGYHPEALIAHWANNWGKLCIETMGGVQGFMQSLL